MDEVFFLLTRRELQICMLLRDGMRVKEIATKLSISTKTVSGHKANIKTKLKVKTSEELGYKISAYF